MATASPTPQPLPADAEPGRGLLPAARLAHRAARTTGSLLTRSARGAEPWWLPVADLPAYLPVFATPDVSRRRERLNDQAGARHPATAAASDAAAVGELPAPGVNLYARKVTEPVPGQDALELWEHVAQFGTGFIYAAMRSLSAAVLTSRAAIGLPDREAHLEALRRHWLVDWITDADGTRPSGPVGHPELLAELANAVTARSELEDRPYGDGELRSRLWEAVAGPGPEAGLLTRRQVAGRRIVLIDPADPYVHDRARTLPAWSPSGLDPEEAVLGAEPGELQRRVEALLSAQDREVLRAYLALEGEGTWAEAAAAAVPGADAFALGERVRRRLKRFGQEAVRRRAAQATGHAAGVRVAEAYR
ncbi:hypothetical protein [Streptomyces regalis]|uniref:Uncharacterized protein n=1 Tax=Streptomyces regalis TaxID=68262 RepID=A0A117MNP3_9ACTN|nr:hypothetical protein [Streptomyces regalis]KUL27339.1 hypothetical protein ADL12_30290 [Streptomyces regalis]